MKPDFRILWCEAADVNRFSQLPRQIYEEETSMNKRIIIGMVICCFTLVNARIDLRGTIEQEDENVIADARVFLKNRPDLNAYSNEAGEFVLTDVHARAAGALQSEKGVVLRTAGNAAGFFVRSVGNEKSIGLEMYRSDGRRIQSVDFIGSGEHFVAFSRNAPGVQFIKVSIGTESEVFKTISGTGMSFVRIAKGIGAPQNSGFAKRTASLVDTLIVSVAPYRTALIGLSSYEKKDLKITMIKSNAWNNCSCAPLPHKGSMVKILATNWDQKPTCDFEMGQWCDTIWGKKDGRPTSDLEQPMHTVVFDHNFLVDTTEVTQGEYDSLMKKTYAGYVTPQQWSVLYGKGARYPVYAVSWDDAALFCNARSKRDQFDTAYSYTGITGTPGSKCKLKDVQFKLLNFGYRLLTEAEWEYCARSWLQTDYWWTKNAADYRGQDSIPGIDLYAICAQNSWNRGAGNEGFGTHTVDSLKANFYFLYGMVGNVSEWCNDLFAPYQWGTVQNPIGDPDWTTESAKTHVIRGGNWGSTVYYLRSANRYFYAPGENKDIFIGFRTMRVIENEL